MSSPPAQTATPPKTIIAVRVPITAADHPQLPHPGNVFILVDRGTFFASNAAFSICEHRHRPTQPNPTQPNPTQPPNPKMMWNEKVNDFHCRSFRGEIHRGKGGKRAKGKGLRAWMPPFGVVRH